MHFLLLAVCAAGNLAAQATVTGDKAEGDLQGLVADSAVPDGTPWNAPGTVRIQLGGSVTIDLGADVEVKALELIADGDDSYIVERAPDGRGREWLWTATPRLGEGLIARRTVFPEPVTARTLRITPRAGDGLYSIARVRVYCSDPGFPSESEAAQGWWSQLDDNQTLIIKGWIAGLAAALLLAGMFLRERFRRLRETLLLWLALISFCAYFNFAHFHFNNFLHVWDFYHYYVGAKYFPELQYTRLYQCTTEAEAELFGEEAVRARAIRNLTTNHIEAAQVDASCAHRFAPARWSAFKEDIRFFRAQMTAAKWNEVLQDHGYNGTPVWAILGRLLASTGPASQHQVFYLALLDPLLLAALWFVVAWAFGRETACVGLVFWGCNFISRYYWIGGSYLRMDWLFAAVAGISLIKKEKPAAGGFLLAYSALLRIFPGFLFGGLALKIAAQRLRPARAQWRIAAGALAALLVFVPVSFAATGGLAAWRGFVDNSRKHLQTPLTNNMGLKTLLSWDPKTRVALARDNTDSDSFARWKEARRETFQERRPLYFALLALLTLVLYWSVRGQPDWVALVLGTALILFAAELTNYYYSILLVYAFLQRERPILGAGLCALGAASCYVPFFAPWDDARYLDLTLDCLGYVLAASIMVAISSRARSGAGA